MTTVFEEELEVLRTEEETALLTTTNTWTAPSTAGTVTLWVVLRDSRGGIGWKSYRVAVQ